MQNRAIMTCPVDGLSGSLIVTNCCLKEMGGGGGELHRGKHSFVKAFDTYYCHKIYDQLYHFQHFFFYLK